MKIQMTLNGKKITEEIQPGMLLLDFVRAHGCKSVKRGCETANCGLCTVFVDDKPVLSCSTLVARVSGHKVDTLEGLQEEAAEFGAFIANQGAEQCGFCNPGMIMNALALFRENPDPSEEEIKECLMTAKISSNKLFELLNRFYSYILLSDSEANDPNWEEYSFMHRILQGDRISRSLLLLMVLFFGSEAELPDPGLVLTVRRMNEILQACRFQVLDENAGEDSLDSFLLTVLCSDDKKAAVDRVIGQMESMQL